MLRIYSATLVAATIGLSSSYVLAAPVGFGAATVTVPLLDKAQYYGYSPSYAPPPYYHPAPTYHQPSQYYSPDQPPAPYHPVPTYHQPSQYYSPGQPPPSYSPPPYGSSSPY